MSAASCLLTEDQFLCSICLDVFTDPVTLSCGHNFCQNCITRHWKSKAPYRCPNCKEMFSTRPQLKINTFIKEMSAQFRQSAQQKSSSSSSERQVPCDVCTGTKVKALKSCLVCLASYCETHLEPHLTKSGLKRHQLMDPVENLEDRMCEKHDKLLELFCKNDQRCVCVLCSVQDHKTHDVVPLKEEYEGKKAELGKTEAEIQQMIQKKRVKIEELKHSVELSDENADREIAEGVGVFSALKESVERRQAELINSIKEKQRETEKQAEGFIRELEQEISELEKRRAEVEQLSRSEDHLQLLQNFTSLNAAPPTKDWTEVRVHPPSYEGTVVRAVKQLEETISEQMKKLFETELKRVQQYEVDVTLNPDTVNPRSPDRPQGNSCRCVLSKRDFTSGRFWFEVGVKKLTSWTVGVVRKMANRVDTQLSPTNGHWTVCLDRPSNYFAAAGPPVRLSLQSGPEKVGVFVDYEEGLVSFYDVDAAALIYSFTGCSFTEKIYPFFSTCRNDGTTIHSVEKPMKTLGQDPPPPSLQPPWWLEYRSPLEFFFTVSKIHQNKKQPAYRHTVDSYKYLGTVFDSELKSLELRDPPTDKGVEAGDVTAATWQWYSDMDPALQGQHSISPPLVVASSLTATTGGSVSTPASTPTPEEARARKESMEVLLLLQDVLCCHADVVQHAAGCNNFGGKQGLDLQGSEENCPPAGLEKLLSIMLRALAWLPVRGDNGHRILQAWVSSIAQQKIPSWWIEGLLVHGRSSEDQGIVNGSFVSNTNIKENTL
ncbi:E3 ubiquitin-protein ligase TRIM39-like [Cheilinus undulatus]|uniref:E3 ubiquitin-protein ligase TRIM39-like n=1 Tax=Cheilinus undulatus TaxID=241271 RepID=UPI001BD3D130|nr:E3 ubiquitin-protein ligase TRIM39-like [Cheilinus undulatus]